MEAGDPLHLVKRLLQGVPVIQIAMESQRCHRPALIRPNPNITPQTMIWSKVL
jgi:hypothetical protein